VKANVLAYFVEERGSSKILLVFANETTWNLWVQVFDGWEARNLIDEDGIIRGPIEGIFSKPIMYIMKSNVTTTLGLRDFNLQELAKDILAKKVSIKNTAKVQAIGCLILLQWIKDKKFDQVIMNELMWLKNQHPLPCKDVSWIPYTDEAWQELAKARGYTPTIVRNIWKELRKDLNSNKLLDGCMSAMSPTTDKLPNGKALDFSRVVSKKFISTKEVHVTIGIVTRSKLVEYECQYTKSIANNL